MNTSVILKIVDEGFLELDMKSSSTIEPRIANHKLFILKPFDFEKLALL